MSALEKIAKELTIIFLNKTNDVIDYKILTSSGHQTGSSKGDLHRVISELLNEKVSVPTKMEMSFQGFSDGELETVGKLLQMYGEFLGSPITYEFL